ncbi:MAG TPA: ester cyclase [Thermoleophilaceae bacterium]|nr:ester cyclase [Thermoleophilaceae bacterium]
MSAGTDLERGALDALAERWAAAWTGQGSFADCCTPDVHYEDPLTVAPLAGPAAVADHGSTLIKVFPDASVDRTAAALERGGHACFPWRLDGTHLGEYGPLPPTEKELSLHGLHYVELSDGLVRRARGFFDLYEAATQLGLLPQRGGLGEAALFLLRGFGLRR